MQAYIARTSILQSRLLSTLDTLDVIQSGQNNELDAMAQTNKRLKDKLLRYSAVVKMAELERDDMRDAVLKLVEKGGSRGSTNYNNFKSTCFVVELSNDYSMWPHSQIRLSSLAGLIIIISISVNHRFTFLYRWSHISKSGSSNFRVRLTTPCYDHDRNTVQGSRFRTQSPCSNS